MFSNSNLLERLQHHFDANPALKQKCLLDAKSKINKSLQNRVFDEFPLLIEPSQFSSFIDKFNKILQEPTAKTVRNFQTEIIQIACDELLDEKGNIKNDIIKMLEWEELASQIDNYNAVCAFVGAATASIVNEVAASIQDNKTFSIVAIHINRNYGKWVVDVMYDNQIPYNPIYETEQINLRDIILFPIKKPLLGISLFCGGVFGVALYGMYELYNEWRKDNKILELPDGLEAKSKPH